MTQPARSESLSILDKHRHRLTAEQYNRLERAIGHLSIEGMYPDENDILRAVRAETGEITREQEKADILRAGSLAASPLV